EVLSGAIRMARRYAAHARELAATATPERREELLRIAEICRRVPAWPARTFHEAAQTLWFIHLWIAQELGGGHGCFCPGRVDQYLYPYYEADVRAGRLSREDAYEILTCLLLKFNEFDPYSTPQTLFVGGQHADGSDASNELSLLCLEVSRDLQMLHPALCVSWHRNLNRDVMRRAVELMGTGIGFPAVFNDEVIVLGLMRDGASREEAVNYMAGSCVEISAIGCSNPWVASGYVNAGKAFERAFQRVARNKNAGWDDLVREFKADLAEAMRFNYEITAAHDHAWQECIRYPFLSCLVNDCIERATDITCGGARYNTTMPELVGLANVVDSLMAVKWACFEEKAMTLPQLAEIVRKNWEGEEALRRVLGSKPPRFGNDMPEPDALWVALSEFWFDEVRKYTNPRGGPYQPGFLCWVMHSVLGDKTGATPDGRKRARRLRTRSARCRGTIPRV
ncbi:MAG TPA: pyruvate formate lyase family protein, partial [Candidatus Latescibacteria bacterium]|nr:pyruvate formate lyase family protein [Candidatus Latescibacterota bacterium]